MFCKTCGQNVQPEDKFCAACGAPQERASSASSSSTAATGVPLVRASSTAELHRPIIRAKTPVRESAADLPLSEPPRQTPPQLRQDPAAPVVQLKQCPRCGKLQSSETKVCDTCGTELEPNQADKADPQMPVIAPLVPQSVEPAAEPPVHYSSSWLQPEPEEEVRRKKVRLPVLEILVAILLLGGAGFAVWMLRSSLPGKSLVPASSVEVTISPSSAEVVAGNGFDFSASVTGTDDAEVTWSVQEGDVGGRVVTRGAKASTGKVSLLAVYIAPSSPGTYHLLATSKADPRKSASAEITVTGR
jgi:hypothetical protein